jgi:hypothetical protein
VRRYLPRQVLVLGDFNVHSSLWGNPRTDARRKMLSDWAAGLGLLLVNRNSVSTCVAWRGSFVVDITWATPGIFRRVMDWRVAEGVETLSDHLYIFMELSPVSTTTAPAMQACSTGGRGARSSRPPPRWRLKERNKELLQTAVTVAAWGWDARTAQGSVDEEAESLREDMSAASDASMLRSVPGDRHSRSVFWWTPEIAETRTRCVRARRRF